MTQLLGRIHPEHLPSPHMCMCAYLECMLILEIFSVLKARLISSSDKVGIVRRRTQMNHSSVLGDSFLGH